MLVMCANHSSSRFHYMVGKYGNLGWLMSPEGWRQPVPWLPYALDNGAYACWTNKTPFDDKGFRIHVARSMVCEQKPLWVLCPDEVANPETTKDLWRKWAPELREYGVPLAFAYQDRMRPSDVPIDAEVVFIGGTTKFKRKSIWPLSREFKRVHVGRINTEYWLDFCAEAGIESVDGTGYFRGDQAQLAGLRRFLERQNGTRKPEPRLFE